MCKVLPMTIGSRQIHVAEIKQKYIRNIIDAASQCDLIDRVVLFGSSLQERCREHYTHRLRKIYCRRTGISNLIKIKAEHLSALLNVDKNH